ncbi:unnamed protein product [Urochloa humidicola]
MAAGDGDKEPNARWQLRHKGRFRKMTPEEKKLARMTSKAAGQKKVGASSSKGHYGRRIFAPPDLKPISAPVLEKTFGNKHYLEMSIAGNKHKFKFNNMKVEVTLSEGDKEVNLNAPCTGEIAAKAADLCESLKQWIKHAYPPTA